ncbi:MAG: nicotinate-nucleotide adenylyltransferase [Clostridia bacterium]|nr:nicotinate-nucleotide adenylyltransferase [Clostridia bacterium]
MEQKMRIGILGGTFQPIHMGHLQMALLAMEELRLDCIHFMIDRIPPHKTAARGANSRQRLRMLRLALNGHPNLIANDMELKRRGISYTADTLEQFAAQNPAAEVFFIIGSDMLRTFLSWKEPQRITRYCSLVCIRRKGQEGMENAAASEIERKLNARVILLRSVLELSSSEIRSRLASALPIQGLVPPAVEDYIYSNGLYSPAGHKKRVRLLKARLPHNRFYHTVGVMKTAVKLANDNGVDGRASLTAALLHDCAKALSCDDLLALTSGEERYLPVLHAEAGAILAKKDYGVEDLAILRAIRLHTTGDAGMTALDKIIYLADIIEPSRCFEGVEEIRAESELDKAILLALRRSIWYIKKKGGALHPATLRAYYDLGGTDEQQIR